MIKKVVLLLAFLFVFTGCQKKEEIIEPIVIKEENKEMEGVFFEGKDFVVNFDLSAGTGFEWMIVFKSGNIEPGENSFHVDYTEEAESGGSGISRFAFKITDDEDGFLIMKLARPWEADGSYESFAIQMENGSIKATNRKTGLNFSNTEFICGSFDEDWIGLFMPKVWEAETIQGEESYGFRFRPQNEKGWMELLRYPSFTYKEKAEEKKTMITEKEYTMGLDPEGKILYLIGPDDMVCLLEDAEWSEQYFDTIIEMIDSIRFE